ncbi:MAG: Fpg/Nei family DNA glycosylase [Acidimicrobiia bacterium]
MLEVETYRRVAELAVGHEVVRVDAPDAWYLKHGTTEDALQVLVGQAVRATDRIGKLLLVELDDDVLGLRFGMTGRLVVDGQVPIERLEYAPHRTDPAWIRFALGFRDLGDLLLVDPRRLGGVELDPATDHLGVDALSVGPAQLRDLLSRSRAPLKAFLLDQGRVAGIGNLLADEMLWRAGLDPARSARSLSAAEARRLHKHLRATILELGDRGGSHTGDLHVHRHRGATCPRDGTPLVRRTIGTRTTYSCPHHQR